jgi:hypothetical protein
MNVFNPFTFKYSGKSTAKQGVKWCYTVKTCNAKIYVNESRKVLLKSDGLHNHEV